MSEAKQILETVINDFSIKEFSRFFREKSRQFVPREENYSRYNDDDFKNGLKLGEIKFSNDDSISICAFEVKKELSERAGKKAQYEKAKHILKSVENRKFSASIFIFYDLNGNFRFSLIYPESIGTRRQWSNFRRFTYFVSREFTNKTFLQRIGDGDFSTLIKTKDAFSVEKVTKEFYLEYHKLFENLLDELSKNHTFLNEVSKNQLNTENFAKKLLGQIVFLYFIQKKGWLGVPENGKWGEGDKNFLSNLFRKAKDNKSNFFNDYLEKLFYNALNNPRRDSADPSFSKDFNSRIPFLNGGLFEVEYNWENSSIYLDDKIFQAIFEVFDRYNFTVEEESPDDKEIAVDPEMLGKVFENLLSENLRKGKGTYYTPREIVYYMCQESLINYLNSNSKIGRKKAEKYVKFLQEDENKSIAAFEGEVIELDELLRNIKVCDPACGSGAFLVGMLNEIVRLRLLLRILHSQKLSKKTEYELKKETIQNCIYGVDIDPGAIEIAKLRLWLQLIVDYKLKDIEPLPNLDYRIMCGNSLLEEFEGAKLYNNEKVEQQVTLLVDTKKQKKILELKKKVKEYFDIHDDKEKQQKRKAINNIKDWLIRSALEQRKQDLRDKRKKAEYEIANLRTQKDRTKHFEKWAGIFLSEGNVEKVLNNLHNPKEAKPFFIWKLEFIDVFEDKKGFDVVIANPPYVDSETMTKSNDDIRNIYKNIYITAKGNWDLFVIFIEKGFQLLKEDGTISYIVPNKLIGASYTKELRKFLLSKNILELRDYSRVDVFKEVSVYPIVFVAVNNNRRGNVALTSMESEIEIKYKMLIKSDLFYKDIYWDKYFLPQNQLEIILKLGLTENLLMIVKKINEAATVSEAYKIKEYLQELSSENTIGFKKFINTGTIDPYISLWGDKKTQYIKHVYINPIISDSDLKKLSENRYKQACANKIVVSGMSKRLECFYDEGQYLAGKSTTIILENEKNQVSLKYLLALMNSQLLSFWYVNYFNSLKMAGGFINVSSNELGLLPILKVQAKQEKPFIEIVDKILAITKSSDYLENPAKKEKVKVYEKQIDKMVYKLYNITPEEIKIIENN